MSIFFNLSLTGRGDSSRERLSKITILGTVSNREGIPLESGPAAIRVEIWVSVPPRFTWDVPHSLLEGINFFQGQDWDKWLEDYSPNVGSARVLRFEPANEEYDEEGSQRVVYTMDLFSEWEMEPEEFEERMSYDWGEGYWFPQPVPWFIDKRSAHCVCASCELIPPIHPPNIPMLGSASKALVRVGDKGSGRALAEAVGLARNGEAMAFAICAMYMRGS